MTVDYNDDSFSYVVAIVFIQVIEMFMYLYAYVPLCISLGYVRQ